MLYVEAPAGVGFSYSNDTADYNTNDTRTAEDNYAFLQGFLQAYPQFQGRNTWVSGESYGGVYVPSLSQLIIVGPNKQLSAAFQGFMIGNPVFRCESDTIAAQFNLYYWHGVVSYSNYINWTDNGCNTNFAKIVCLEIYNTTLNEIGILNQQVSSVGPPSVPLPSIDPDDLFQDFCTGNASLSFSIEEPSIAPDCTSVDTLLSNYLNNPQVQQAIHARPAFWQACTNVLNYTANFPSMLPFYEDFFKERPDLNILVYSGDVDIATVPFAITQRCLNDLGRKTLQNWQPWYVNGATAGYWEVKNGYTYATVKGAGHEAPAYESWNAYNMFTRFLSTQSLKDPSMASMNKVGISNTHRLRQGKMLRADPIDRV
jgi:carboxypeptidase C (cathepsin A)